MDFEKLMTDSIAPTLEIAKEAHRRSLATKPFPRRSRDRIFAIMQHMLSLQQRKSYMNKKLIRCQCIAIQQRHSGKELSDLSSMRPIRLRDMQVNFVHEGRCLVCRTVVPPFYEAALTTLVEDCDGEVETLHIYNFSRSYDVDASYLLPEGTVLIIKEPFIKLTGKPDVEKGAINGVHVDSPSDVIEVVAGMLTGGPLDEDIKMLYPKETVSFERMKAEGNNRFVKKQYEEAIRYYTKALNEKQDAVVLANRAAAYLALDQFWPAHKDAKASSDLDPTNIKSHFRAGKAAYGMRQWSDAVDWFTKCLNVDASNADVKRELNRSKARLLESTTGSYDLITIYDQFKAGKLYFDVADYESPDIGIKDIEGKNKGVVALKDIKKGTLLVCSKAAVWATDVMSFENLGFLFDVYNNKALKDSEIVCRPRLIYMMRFNPYLADSVYSLYAGEKYQRPVKKVHGDHVLIDVARLDAIKAFNDFSSESMINALDSQRRNLVKDVFDSNSGLWIYPSFFNHSCLSNGHREMYGDLMLIFARFDIPKNEEITLSYVSYMNNFEDRIKTLQHFKLSCKCQLCETDLNDEKRSLRDRLISNFLSELPSKKNTNNARLKLKWLRSYEDKIRQSYLKRPIFQFGLRFPLQEISYVYFHLREYKNQVRVLVDLFNTLTNGYPTYIAISVALEIAACKRHMLEFKESDEWVKRAIELNCVGDETFFRHCNKEYLLLNDKSKSAKSELK